MTSDPWDNWMKWKWLAVCYLSSILNFLLRNSIVRRTVGGFLWVSWGSSPPFPLNHQVKDVRAIDRALRSLKTWLTPRSQSPSIFQLDWGLVWPVRAWRPGSLWRSGGVAEWQSDRGSLARRVSQGQDDSRFPSLLLLSSSTCLRLAFPTCTTPAQRSLVCFFPPTRVPDSLRSGTLPHR